MNNNDEFDYMTSEDDELVMYEDCLLDWTDYDGDMYEGVLALQYSDYVTRITDNPDSCIPTTSFNKQGLYFYNLIPTNFYINEYSSETGELVQKYIVIRIRYDSVETCFVRNRYEVVYEYYAYFTVDGYSKFSDLKLHLGKCHNGLNKVQLDSIDLIVDEIYRILSELNLNKY